MKNQSKARIRKQFSIMLGDLLLCFVSVYFALCIRNLNVIEAAHLYLLNIKKFLPIIPFCIIFLYTLRLYDLDRTFVLNRTIPRFSIIALLNFFVGFVFFYFNSNQLNFPKSILAYYCVINALLQIAYRAILDRIYSQIDKKNVFFIGVKNEATLKDIENKFETSKYVNFKEAFVYRDLKDLDELCEKLNTVKQPVFVYNKGMKLPKNLQVILNQKQGENCMFYSYSEFYEYLLRKIPIEDIDIFWTLDNINVSDKTTYLIIKRIFDILFSVIIFVLTLPFWPFICLAIKIEDKGPVLFTQERLGRNNVPFKLRKFRTMRVQDNDFHPVSDNDDRITKVGKFLRKTRIDEIPQILNILKGEMSLIGPRPERPSLAQELNKEIPFYNQRTVIKPGITGWDQICGEYHSPSVEDTYKKLQSDLYYIKNLSIQLDVSIIFKTIITVFKREGK